MARSIEEIQNDIAKVDAAIKEIKARKENRGQFSSAQLAKMYSLNPEAAEFFANKQINEDRAVSMALRAAAAGKNKEATLEQKTRLVQTALGREKANYDKAVADFGLNSNQAQRAKKAFDELTIEIGSADPSVNAAYARAGQLVPREVGLDEVESIRDLIKNAKFDEFGVLNDIDDILNSIENWRTENSISVEDPTYKNLIKLLEDKEKGRGISASGKQAIAKEERARTDAEEKEIVALDKDYKALYKYTEKPPVNTQQRGLLLNLILRDETGAAIASDEAKNLAVNLITEEKKRNALIDKWDTAITTEIDKRLKGFGGSIELAKAYVLDLPWSEIAGFGKILDEAVTAVDPKALQEYGRAKIPEKYIEYKKDKAPKPSTKADSEIKMEDY